MMPVFVACYNLPVMQPVRSSVVFHWLVVIHRYRQAGLLLCANHSASDWWKSSLGRNWKRCDHLHPTDGEWVWVSFIQLTTSDVWTKVCYELWASNKNPNKLFGEWWANIVSLISSKSVVLKSSWDSVTYLCLRGHFVVVCLFVWMWLGRISPKEDFS